ncbi:hypothetical protein [Azospirillum halopraeferens]|uniref:hypothetical protein n=1 Tax=Azospirillum halopraeferens TaxID=34010 RepID=UPI000688A465|nr:hypothetical protein [Azospirillum halopraeferens]
MEPLSLDILSEGERALVSAVRIWFRSGTAKAMVPIRLSLAAARIPPEALLPLFALLGVFAADADSGRRLQVERPGAAALGADEQHLLEALGAFQHGEDAAGMDMLDRWLPLVALCMASAAARDLGRVLTEAGVFLPCRSIAYPVAAE